MTEDDSQIAADPGIDTSEPYETETLESLRSSIWQHQVENGRTYHSMNAGKYSFPNDEQETDRLDLQHQLWIMSQEGELALNPGHKTAKRVLDMGAGSGIWAIDFADAHPEAIVTGVDLSPNQPAWVPPNCRFEVDDLENEWIFKEPFDFIHCRGNAGCFASVPGMVDKVFRNLAPGGWFETGDLDLPMGCDDDTVGHDSAVRNWHELLYDASIKAGSPLDAVGKDVSVLERAGFEDVQVRVYKWPFNTWPKDDSYKAIGKMHCMNLDMGLEAFSLGLLTRVMGWTKEEVLTLCAEVRKEIRDQRLHGYWRLRVVYGRKPS